MTMFSHARSPSGGTLNRLFVYYRGSRSRTFVDLTARKKLYELKYNEKLQRRAQSEGLSLDDLMSKATAESKRSSIPNTIPRGHSTGTISSNKVLPNQCRKDSVSIKPLTDIMNVQKILSEGYSQEQISSLWTGYHATLSQGTGRGYISSVIPSNTYLKMVGTASKYPFFILPLLRTSVPSNERLAQEFYFLQWDFYDLFHYPLEVASPEDSVEVPLSLRSNPPSSKVLFTTLQEYKHRQTFALPYLCLTHYTDLATTHGIILMRGELTISPTSETYLLSQADAQILAMGLQRFYLAADGDRSEERRRLLSCFHEKPESFKWEELLSFADPSV